MQIQGGRLPKAWTISDAAETYGIHEWGNNYFRISDDGHVLVTIPGAVKHTIDVKALVDEVRQRGVGLPLLLRFSDILRCRIDALNQAFQTAIAQYEYPGTSGRGGSRALRPRLPPWARGGLQTRAIGRPCHAGR
jgi:arginine decarboxylase-like protein